MILTIEQVAVFGLIMARLAGMLPMSPFLDGREIFSLGKVALIFWMAEKNRWKENSGEGTFDWHLGGQHQGQLLPLGRCLWDGAYADVRPIEEPGPKGSVKWIGLYLPRIS